MLRPFLRYRFSTAFQDPVLKKLGFTNRNLLTNLSVPELYEFGISRYIPSDPLTRPSVITTTGALCTYSGHRTGRSPKDKRVVHDKHTKNEVWWGENNIPISPDSNAIIEECAINYLNNRKFLFMTDGYIGWDPKYRLKCRVVSTRSYHALFMRNMLVAPTDDELKKDFRDGKIDFHIINAGGMMAPSSPLIKDLGSDHCCISVNLSERRLTLLGTQYAGEMKKGLFTALQYLMPKKGVLTLQASANEGEKGDVSLIFGVAGAGKTTLSADPKRRLIGDDEHGWTESGIFNLEAGCYAKCVGLSEDANSDIYKAIKFGTVLENVEFYDDFTREANYRDRSVTENIRAAYPLEYISNAKIPAIGTHPSNLIFLTCDAFGVLPPVAHLTTEQAIYYFLSGYSSKVAVEEFGVSEPVPTFSSCYASDFLSLPPVVYANMLLKKLKKHKSSVWLLNSGSIGGKYGTGKQMDLNVIRRILDLIHDGTLSRVPTKKSPIFGLDVPMSCPGIEDSVLKTEETWSSKGEFEETLRRLATAFLKNFKVFEGKVSKEIQESGPRLE